MVQNAPVIYVQRPTGRSFAAYSTSSTPPTRWIVTRLDRLARSTRDLLNTLATITAKKAGFKSLGDAWADTTTSHGRLMLTVLGGLAEFERDLIRARTGEGRVRAVRGASNWGGRQSSRCISRKKRLS